MKYFTIGTLALAGFSQAKLDAATTVACTGDAAQNFANQQIADAGGNADDYVIKFNDLQNGNVGKFLTIMCRAAPWQHNGDVYDPYSATKWDKEKAAEYAKYEADNLARTEWLKSKVANPGYPAGTGGKAWCGYKGDGTTPQWNFMDATPLCPNHDEVNEWHKFNEAQSGSAVNGYTPNDSNTFRYLFTDQNAGQSLDQTNQGGYTWYSRSELVRSAGSITFVDEKPSVSDKQSFIMKTRQGTGGSKWLGIRAQEYLNKKIVISFNYKWISEIPPKNGGTGLKIFGRMDNDWFDNKDCYDNWCQYREERCMDYDGDGNFILLIFDHAEDEVEIMVNDYTVGEKGSC